jgi:peptide/nickel transport system substrate-binding protein
MRFRLISSAVALIIAIALIGCGKEKEERGRKFTTPRAELKTLVYGRGGDSVGLDPAHEDDGESFKVCDSIYETLVRYKEDSTEVEPALATSWDVSEDGLEWTFYLRRNVAFHDGTPFNAAAVVFSFERQYNPHHPFHNVGGPYKYWEAMSMSDIVEKVEAIDEYTVKFTLKRAYAPFLNALALPPFSIVSPTALRKWGVEFSSHPVGTGPFKFLRWDRDDKIILEANDDYWGGRPKIDRLIFRSIPDNSVRLMELESGAIDAMDDPNPDDIPRIESNPNLVLLKRTGLNIVYLAMNTRKKPFDDVRVRKAINHAINKNLIVSALYGGLAVPAKNPFPPEISGYNDEIQDYEYNPNLARRLLRQAGYPNGFRTTLWAMSVPRPYAPKPLKLAEAIKADLEKIGVRAEIVTYEWGTYLEKVENGEHDMAILGWIADFADPDNFLYILLSKDSARKPALNISFYIDDEFDSLVRKAQGETDQVKREALYRKAQEIFHRDAPWVCIAHNSQMAVISGKVKGFKLHPASVYDFRKVWVENGTK